VTSTPPPAAAGAEILPPGVQRVDGHLADAAGRALYTFDHDTMAGMSHCVGSCAQAWPPLAAPADAKPVGAWTPIWRDDGTAQWAYRDKPLYAWSGDRPGAPPAGESQPGWRLAR
jgi:predicted lipoprotein with Yx(FWY)xxD motif